MMVSLNTRGLRSANQIIGAGGSAGATIGTAAVLGTSLATAGITAGVGLAVAGVMTWLNSIAASHAADTLTTAIVNDLATKLQANLDAFKAGPHTCADKAAALAAYDAAWAWLISPQACGNPSPQVQAGGAGQRCISDRAPNGKYPWQSYYRDPIANTTPSDTDDADCTAWINSGAQANAIANLANLTGNQSLLAAAQSTLPGTGSSSSTGGVSMAEFLIPAGLILLALTL